MSVESNVVVCDPGSGSQKIGFAGDNFPRFIVPSIVGEHEDSGSPSLSGGGKNNKPTLKASSLFGEEALKRRQTISWNNPIEGGVVRNWDNAVQLWHHSFDDLLGIKDASSMKILLTEPPLNPKFNKQKLVEKMFEEFNFGAVNISNQCILVLYAQGLLTGLVVECGEGVTNLVPVYQGFVPHHLARRHSIAGKDITKYLGKLLQQHGYKSSSFISDLEVLRTMKEMHCFAACDVEAERKLAKETTALVEKFILPDGTPIKVGKERFEATEAYFDPYLVGVESKGLSDIVFDVIQEADIDCRMDYYQHIVMSGGSSMFPGMPNRLEKDIRSRFLEEILKGDETRVKKFKINVEAPSNRKHLVFLGGSVLADLMKDKDEFWITKTDYEELGIERALSSLKM